MTQDMKKDTILHTMTQGDCPSVTQGDCPSVRVTDIATQKNEAELKDVVKNWMRQKKIVTRYEIKYDYEYNDTL